MVKQIVGKLWKLKQTPAALHVMNAVNCTLKTGVWHYSYDLLQIPLKLYWLSLRVDQFLFYLFARTKNTSRSSSEGVIYSSFPSSPTWKHVLIASHYTKEWRRDVCYRLLKVTKKQHARFQSAPVSSMIIHGEGKLLQKQQKKKKSVFKVSRCY